MDQGSTKKRARPLFRSALLLVSVALVQARWPWQPQPLSPARALQATHSSSPAAHEVKAAKARSALWEKRPAEQQEAQTAAVGWGRKRAEAPGGQQAVGVKVRHPRADRKVAAAVKTEDIVAADKGGGKQQKQTKKRKSKANKGQEEGDDESSPSSSMGYVAKFMDEVRYRVNGLDSYRQSVMSRVDASLERFQKKSQQASEGLRHDVDQQLGKALALHEWYMEHISQQQQRLAELTRSEIRQRQHTFNQSLEQFKRSYDDTLSQLKPPAMPSLLTKAELKAQQQRLDESFATVMAQYMNSTTELRNFLERMVSFSGDLVPRLTHEDEHVSGLVSRLREQQRTRMSGLGRKPDLRDERLRWEEALDLLKVQQEKMLKGLSGQAADMERSLKTLREKLLTFNQMYEDLIARKESKLYVETMNDKILKRVLDCLDETEADGWEFVTESRGVRVHRKHLPSLDGKVSKYCCVKATGVIEAAPETILRLFEDNTRVAEYNKFYAEGRDLEEINESTKVVWASSPPMFFFKPRDFCTVVHYRKLQDGTVCVVNRGAEHPDAPRSSRYVRAEILMGANIIQPIPNEPNRAIFTIVTQVDPGGFAPPAIVNKVSSLGPVSFFKEIEAAAKRPPPTGGPVVNKDFSL